MIIRKAKLEELSRLKEIADLANRQRGCPDDWVHYLESDPPISESFLYSHAVFVAEEDCEIKGFYALSHEHRLNQLYVLPDSLGTGCGKELFLHAMEQRLLVDK
ncbi:MAG TPA: GNAT family N-acetyltransferase [Pyrinomonadaceae bacterium]|nr:GNAT family N-acetyltransferase [Pyrinomonadaceae bacterium]